MKTKTPDPFLFDPFLLPYTAAAEAECAAFHKNSGRIIKLITVQEILDEQHVQKM